MIPPLHEEWMFSLIEDELVKIEPSLKFGFLGADNKILSICCSDFENYYKYIESSSVKFLSDNMDEMTKFIRMWVKKWWKKYKERVQIAIFKAGNKHYKMVLSPRHITNIFSEDEINGIKDAVQQTFIRHGEICCTKILSDALFSRVLGRFSKKIKWNDESKINFMASLIREAKKMSQVHGYLIFIKPDKDYYKLREYRDDGANLIN